MKGPGGKLKYHARRFWECPSCRRKEWTPGHVVSHRCRCVRGGDPERQYQMKLIEEKRPARLSYPDPEARKQSTQQSDPGAAAPGPDVPDEAAALEPVAEVEAVTAPADETPNPPETDTTRGDTDAPETDQAPPV
ncbi:MAG: hypothetical protein AB7K24_06890 [Gemmataceae bacterium]